jgi:hypothetical protein
VQIASKLILGPDIRLQMVRAIADVIYGSFGLVRALQSGSVTLALGAAA